ncbi:MAG TPA: type I 3-dehydroquinate dehydratase, partial [Syntrophales bacterium]|nr:type I 3-dehydroquinate dehydratase [Syntrophales bacterium]
TMACSPEDNLTVLSLIPYAGRRNREIIAFCMGEQGRISRVMAALLGAFFTFASLKRGAESAAGQLTVREMEQIFRILGQTPEQLR